MNTANILVVDDESDIRTLIEEILTDEGYRVATAGDAAEARQQLVTNAPDLVLLDIWMPDTDGITLLGEWSKRGDLKCPVVIMSGHGTVETAVEATRLGAVDFVEKPLSIAKLLRTVEKGLESRRLQSELPGHRDPAAALGPVGKSKKMQALRRDLERVGARDVSVSFIGESGSGREASARFVHMLSNRREQPFVTVNSAVIPADEDYHFITAKDTSWGIQGTPVKG